MIQVTVYEISTGEIKRIITCAEQDVELNTKEGEDFYLGGYSDSEYHFPDGVLTLRPESPISLSSQRVSEGEPIRIFSGVGALLVVSGDGNITSTITEEGEQVIFDTEGEYKLTFTQFPFLPVVFKVTVNGN